MEEVGRELIKLYVNVYEADGGGLLLDDELHLTANAAFNRATGRQRGSMKLHYAYTIAFDAEKLDHPETPEIKGEMDGKD